MEDGRLTRPENVQLDFIKTKHLQQSLIQNLFPMTDCQTEVLLWLSTTKGHFLVTFNHNNELNSRICSLHNLFLLTNMVTCSQTQNKTKQKHPQESTWSGLMAGEGSLWRVIVRSVPGLGGWMCGRWLSDPGFQVWTGWNKGQWSLKRSLAWFHSSWPTDYSLVWINWCLINFDRWLKAFPQVVQS